MFIPVELFRRAIYINTCLFQSKYSDEQYTSVHVYSSRTIQTSNIHMYMFIPLELVRHWILEMSKTYLHIYIFCYTNRISQMSNIHVYVSKQIEQVRQVLIA